MAEKPESRETVLRNQLLETEFDIDGLTVFKNRAPTPGRWWLWIERSACEGYNQPRVAAAFKAAAEHFGLTFEPNEDGVPGDIHLRGEWLRFKGPDAGKPDEWIRDLFGIVCEEAQANA